MSAQPYDAPVTPYAPAPAAPAELLAQLRADRRAEEWVPAFEREWAAALEDSSGGSSSPGCTRSSRSGRPASPPLRRSRRSSPLGGTRPGSW